VRHRYPEEGRKRLSVSEQPGFNLANSNAQNQILVVAARQPSPNQTRCAVVVLKVGYNYKRLMGCCLVETRQIKRQVVSSAPSVAHVCNKVLTALTYQPT
jgi:hypothetical protein